MTRYAESMKMFERAQRVTPGGAQTGSKAPGRVGPLGAFPLYVDGREASNGATVRDVDGNRYIDFFNGNCAVTLGHGYPEVTRRVTEALRAGALPSLPSRLEVEVAEQLVDVLPDGFDQVRFVKTGSEACAAAVRLARMATGRRLILTIGSGYHGWHDWFTVLRQDHPGVPEYHLDGLETFRYNDLDSVDRVLAICGDQVAAIMLEPTLVEKPVDGFLEGLKARAHARGALLIFDEMICGARWALGGGSEYFGVTPDLATYGKAFANGLPLAFVAGRADVMAHAWAISGTFGGDVVSLAACQAVLYAYQTDEVVDRLWHNGRVLMEQVNIECLRRDLPGRMFGYPCRPVLKWHGSPQQVALLTALFQQELARNGVLSHPSGWNMSAAHDQVIDEAMIRIGLALGQLSDWYRLRSSWEELATHLEGELLRPAFARATS